MAHPYTLAKNKKTSKYNQHSEDTSTPDTPDTPDNVMRHSYDFYSGSPNPYTKHPYRQIMNSAPLPIERERTTTRPLSLKVTKIIKKSRKISADDIPAIIDGTTIKRTYHKLTLNTKSKIT